MCSVQWKSKRGWISKTTISMITNRIQALPGKAVEAEIYANVSCRCHKWRPMKSSFSTRQQNRTGQTVQQTLLYVDIRWSLGKKCVTETSPCAVIFGLWSTAVFMCALVLLQPFHPLLDAVEVATNPEHNSSKSWTELFAVGIRVWWKIENHINLVISVYWSAVLIILPY